MEDVEKYTVTMSGEVELGHSVEQAKAAFVRLFKISEEKAERYFEGEPRVLRRGLARDQAEAYLRALQKMGLICKLIPQDVPARALEEGASPTSSAPSMAALSIVPMESEAVARDTSGLSVVGVSTGQNRQIVCPKCGAKQDRAEECSRCGIVFAKYQQRQDTMEAAPRSGVSRMSRGDERQTAVEPALEAASLNPLAIAVAAVVALLGAWVWSLLAASTGFEFGIVAWGIGGAVGTGAALAGGRGLTCASICAVLTLVAILGGKYLTMERFKDNWSQEMSGAELWDEDAVAFFEELRLDAKLYHELDGSDDALRKFIYSRDYSAAATAAAVTDVDIDEFNEFDRPTLEWIHAKDPDYESWQAYTMSSISDVSSLELIREDFGIMDALFLVLGLGTAFRLGRGNG